MMLNNQDERIIELEEKVAEMQAIIDKIPWWVWESKCCPPGEECSSCD
ncbi:hypothetical protein LCGC14_1152380 [marine sediment metagenome]|uniref:Uncharacterized protein n=1 Tax=marine sediment metagenome TaxID=412755 RepID=A0A0F9LZZ5_9ZZZZ